MRYTKKIERSILEAIQAKVYYDDKIIAHKFFSTMFTINENTYLRAIRWADRVIELEEKYSTRNQTKPL